ncbi:MAG: glycosyltransferase [Bacteroidales bacterium]
MEKSNKKKKFCYISAFHRDNNEIVLYRQSKTLIENNFEVFYVVSDNKSEEIIEGVQFKPSGFNPKGYLKRIFFAPYLAYRKAISIDADIYQTSSVDFIFIMLLIKLKNKKIIFHLDEAHPFTININPTIPKFFKKLMILLISQWMKYSLKLFNAVFTISDDIKEYLIKWGVRKVYLLGNFPTVNYNYSLTYEDYIRRDNRIIYFGLIYKLSRQEVFLEAIKEIDDVDYLIAGLFNDNEYEKKITSLEKWKDVKFIKGFNKSKLVDFLSNSTISNVLRDFSLTGTPNGSMGIIKIFESMEAALPIICSDVPVYREMMEKYKCGILVNPNDSIQIKNAIKFLIENKKNAYEMGQAGRKAVIEKYSWDIKSHLYLCVINECLHINNK